MVGTTNRQRALGAPFVISVAISVAGCGQGNASDDDDDGPGTFSAVTGRRHRRCHQVSGDVDVPVDLSKSVIQVFVPDPGPTGHRVLNGTGQADGTLVVPDVPDGVDYLLRLDGNYYVTDQHTLEWSSESSIRCAPPPTPVTMALPVTFSLGQMTPYSGSADQSDRLEALSFAVGGHLILPTLGMAEGDATHPTVGTFDWRQSFGGEVDAAAGDDFHMLHVRVDRERDPATQRTHRTTRIVDHAELTGTTLKPGAPVAIAGSFQPVTPDRSVSFSIDRAAYDAGYSGTSSPDEMLVRITAHPTVHTTGGAVLAEFRLTDFSRSTSLVQAIENAAYGDPFPATWKRTLFVSYGRNRNIRIPSDEFDQNGSTSNTFVSAFSGEIAPPPPLPLALGARVAGVDFDTGGKVAFDGVAPLVVSWNAVPGATAYVLFVLRSDAIGVDFLPAVITTANTTLAIPTVALGSGPIRGGYYQFLLAAIQSPADYRAGELLLTGLPSANSEIISGRFHLLSSCGDGVVQALEEECDTAGESSTCNVDCTKPVCGDGLRNAAAGEACDDAGDSVGCTSACKISRCGDGVVNRATEDCDDFNTVDDGNGCTADCKFNNVCGNGRVEVGEQCDDGPRNGNGTCTATCEFRP